MNSEVASRADAEMLSQQFSQREKKSKFKISRAAIKTMTQVTREPAMPKHTDMDVGPARNDLALSKEQLRLMK